MTLTFIAFMNRVFTFWSDKLVLMHHNNLSFHLVKDFAIILWKNCIILSLVLILNSKSLFTPSACIWWPKLHASVSKFIAVCKICKCIKHSTSLPAGLLYPFSILISYFTSWSMAFLIFFLRSQGYNAFFVYL